VPGHKLVLCAGSKVLEAQVRHKHIRCKDYRVIWASLASRSGHATL
jgi:hypothetical protein